MRKGKWSADEKQKIILAGLRNETSIAELCRNHGISDALYYKWKKAFLEGSISGLRGNGNAGIAEAALRKENEELKAMIGELTVENRFLKKYKGHKGLQDDRNGKERRTSPNQLRHAAYLG